jgi:hypothetical protein
MNMPGFTGEESLYTSRAQYNITATGFLAAKADIRPQLPVSSECTSLGSHLRGLYRGLGLAVGAGDWDMAHVYMQSIDFYQRAYSEACG